MSNRLNVFFPYRSKDEQHEDELTRGFLILVKNIPLVSAVIIDMIRDFMVENNIKYENLIEPITNDDAGIVYIDTQVSDTDELFKRVEGKRVLSILISDEKMKFDETVENVDRNARYDGVVVYDPKWLLIIENKPSHNNVYFEQLKVNVGSEVEVEPLAISLSWRNIIKSFSSLVQRDLLNPLERSLVVDFLEYVDTTYSWLNPFNRFGICKDDRYLLERRCNDIMNELQMCDEVRYQRGWHYYIPLDYEQVRQLTLYPEFTDSDWKIVLHAHPGNNMRQSKTLYKTIDLLEIIKLAEEKWVVKPHFVVSFMSSNLMYTETGRNFQDYIDYWINNIDGLRQIKRTDDMDEFSLTRETLFKREHMLTNEDIHTFDEKIASKKYSKLNLCPGLEMKYSWSSKEVVKLDNQNIFIEEVRNKALEFMKAIGVEIE